MVTPFFYSKYRTNIRKTLDILKKQVYNIAIGNKVLLIERKVIYEIEKSGIDGSDLCICK